nr:NAD(P)H-hydrate dehydratase [Halobacterium bonnevillei]
MYSENLIVDAFVGTRLLAEHVPELLDRAADVDVVVLGPGLGDTDDTLAAVRRFLAAFDGKVVVDADALQVVPDVETDGSLVCTPHQGELRGMGGPSAEAWRERADAVTAFADELGHALLVKGAYDVVSDGRTTRVNRTGNPGMTVGGTGDVLAGVTAAMFSTMDALPAASIAAYANGRAGDDVVGDYSYGLLATDLLDALPAALWGDDDE